MIIMMSNGNPPTSNKFQFLPPIKKYIKLMHYSIWVTVEYNRIEFIS